MKNKAAGLILILILVLTAASQTAFADQNDLPQTGNEKAVRTIMLYDCGSNLETYAGMATYNLHQILKAKFSADEDVRFIVMTGGSEKWQLESEYISADPALLPEGESADEVSGNYNQIWEARGIDAVDENGAPDPNAGKMVLLDGDGITKETPVRSENELMSDKETLRAFINYCVGNYPAEKYDLILWDHGCGPTGGFGMDDHDPKLFSDSMPFSGIVDAIGHNDLTDPKEGTAAGRFDFIDFDACLMNTVEYNMMLADYADYYIASPETEPGFGQDYEGWLNTLGNDPNTDTFELGKQIVDDFIQFYESGEGAGQDGTLAVVDLKKLMERGLADVLNSLSTILRDQAAAGLFYDELLSVRGSIQYGMEDFYDFGNLAALLSVVSSEISEEQIQGSTISNENAYSDAGISSGIGNLLNDDEVIYAAGTQGIHSKGQIYRSPDGDTDFGELTTSGMYIFFINSGDPEKAVQYYDEMSRVIEMLPDEDKEKEDGRYAALKNYMDAMLDYVLIMKAGKTVDELIHDHNTDPETINYNTVKDYWKSYDGTVYEDNFSWEKCMGPLIEMTGGETEETIAWLDSIIRQQADEAVKPDKISVSRLKQKKGTGLRVYIKDSKKRVIDSVERRISAEIPAINDYVLKNFNEDAQDLILELVQLSLGSENGYLTNENVSSNTTLEDIIHSYNEKESVWTLSAIEEKWYAIKDASGKLHAAAILEEDDDTYYVEANVGTGKKQKHVILAFDKNEDGNCSLSEVSFVSEGGNRPVKPESITDSLSIMPVLYYNYWDVEEYFLPTSDTTFELNAGNADKISLVFTDIRDIGDIRDLDGDGEALHSSVLIKDIYKGEIDITDLVKNTEEELVDIKLARVKPAIFTGEKIEPEIYYRGEKLIKGEDYNWEFIPVAVGSPEPELKETGKYGLLVEGLGKFTGYLAADFYIVMPEDEAEALIRQAQTEYDAAMAELQASISSGDQDQLDAAYARLVNAQNALSEAISELELTKEAMSEEKQAELEEEIDVLKDKIEDLTNELDEAKILDISNFRAALSKTSYVYNGKGHYPKLTVAGLSSSEYNVSYKNNKNVGTAVVEITGKGRYYKGKIQLKFRIVPKKAKISKIKAGKKKITVKAGTKVSKTGGAKYEIRYKAKGTSKWKKKVTSKRTVTIRKLKKGKKYQVKIRAYKKEGGKTYYGAWSSVKTSGKVR